MPDIVQVIKSRIRKSKMTNYEIAKKSGVDTSVVARFMSGQRDINLATASKLAGVFDLQLQKPSGAK